MLGPSLGLRACGELFFSINIWPETGPSRKLPRVNDTVHTQSSRRCADVNGGGMTLAHKKIVSNEKGAKTPR
jgi:hypothetical protein